MVRGGRAAGVGVAATALAALALALPGAAAAVAVAGTDTIVAPGHAYTGGNGTSGAFRLIAGSRTTFDNQDLPSERHNVVAVEDGPDGEPLFRTPLIAGGAQTLVQGTEYLPAGTYAFYCTIHSEMTGNLEVLPGKTEPRPAIDVALASTKLKQLDRSGFLKARLSAATEAQGIDVSARVGGKGAGREKDIELEAGSGETLELKLGAAARKAVDKALEHGKKLPVKVSAEVPWGAPAAATSKLR